MDSSNGYKHLEQRAGSSYRQMYIKGRKIFAAFFYGQTLGEDARTPEELAADYDLPVEAILEAVDYSIKNEALIREERERDWADIRVRGLDKPPLVPPDFMPHR